MLGWGSHNEETTSLPSLLPGWNKTVDNYLHMSATDNIYPSADRSCHSILMLQYRPRFPRIRTIRRLSHECGYKIGQWARVRRCVSYAMGRLGTIFCCDQLYIKAPEHSTTCNGSKNEIISNLTKSFTHVVTYKIGEYPANPGQLSVSKMSVYHAPKFRSIMQ